MKHQYLIAVMAGAAVWATTDVNACRCMPPPSAAEALPKAAAVFVGTVQEVKDAEDGRMKVVTLKVDQSWKGLARQQRTVTVTTCGDGACCGFYFEPANAYVVYATAGEDGKTLQVSLCSRTRPLTGNEEEVLALNEAVQGKPGIAASPRPTL